MARLRAPGGCPWDREQTFESIKPYTLQETYEVLDAIDRRDWDELRDELGDFLLQAVFFAQMASEEKLFDIADSLRAINEKLIRRHPHVFADETAHTEGDVRKRWDRDQSRGAPRKSRKEFGAPRRVCFPAFRAPCPRWSRRSRSRRARRASVSTGRMPVRCWRSSMKSVPNSPKRAPKSSHDRMEDELGDLLAVRAGQSRRGFYKVDPGTGAAPHECEIPPAI